MTTGTETPERQTIPTDTFEARLMLARLHAGRLSIREAAERCGFTNESWSGWERGRRPHDKMEIAEVIAEELGVDYQWLLHGGPLVKEERRPVRLLARRRKESAAAQPTAHYPTGADHRSCVPTRATSSPVRPISPLNHTAASRTSSGPGRRTSRIDRPAS